PPQSQKDSRDRTKRHSARNPKPIQPAPDCRRRRFHRSARAIHRANTEPRPGSKTSARPRLLSELAKQLRIGGEHFVSRPLEFFGDIGRGLLKRARVLGRVDKLRDLLLFPTGQLLDLLNDFSGAHAINLPSPRRASKPCGLKESAPARAKNRRSLFATMP